MDKLNMDKLNMDKLNMADTHNYPIKTKISIRYVCTRPHCPKLR